MDKSDSIEATSAETPATITTARASLDPVPPEEEPAVIVVKTPRYMTTRFVDCLSLPAKHAAT